MINQVYIYNTLSGKKEEFKPSQSPNVGIYVCGPTVYSEVHLGNCRTFISFDIVVRYLRFIGYNVRYVRNITDAGHLENDADVGEDKIAEGLTKLAHGFPAVEFGSYPRFDSDEYRVKVTVESRDRAQVEAGLKALLEGLEPEWVVRTE